MGLRYLFHFCSAEGGQKDCTLEIFLPGYGKKRQKNRILQTNFESKRVDLPKEFDFSFFSQITFFMFCYVFWRFWQQKKKLCIFLQNFSKHCEISNCSTIWKKWCFGWKQKWNITTAPRWGIDVENGNVAFFPTI